MTEAEATPRQESRPAKAAEGVQAFSFDAATKPVVKSLLDYEAKQQKRFLAKKPKLPLEQLRRMLQNGAAADAAGKQIEVASNFYYGHDMASQYFEALGLVLLEAAGAERGDASRQRYLLFQALDAFSIAIQKSQHMLNLSAQSAVVSVYKLLGQAFRENYAIERAVHREMSEMLNVRKDPADLSARDKIIKYYLKGRRYYEALAQTAEYEHIMRATSRPLYLQRQGDVAYRKAGIFQAVIDFFYQVMTERGQESSMLSDWNKLNAFIRRFNRDNRANITPLKGLDGGSLHKTLASMVGIANNFYDEALAAEQFAAKHKAAYFKARNHFRFDNAKAAVQDLQEAIRLVDVSRLAADKKVGEKLQIMEFQARIYGEQGMQNQLDEVNREMNAMRRDRRNAGSSSSSSRGSQEGEQAQAS